MKLKELVSDIERYFKEDCYCPNEVYSVDGFFFQLVFADAECEKLGEYDYENSHVILVSTFSGSEYDNPILMTIWVDGEKVTTCERYELTENNISEIKGVLEGKNEIAHLSEHKKVKGELDKILAMCDAVSVS